VLKLAWHSSKNKKTSRRTCDAQFCVLVVSGDLASNVPVQSVCGGTIKRWDP
jgi:hypothetical protein